MSEGLAPSYLKDQ